MLRWCCLGRHEAAPPGPTNRQQQINFPLLLGLLAGVIRYTGGQGKTENSTPRKAAGSSVCWNLVPGSARVGGVCRGAPGAPRGAPGYPRVKNLHFVHFWAPGPIAIGSSRNFRSNGPGPI